MSRTAKLQPRYERGTCELAAVCKFRYSPVTYSNLNPASPIYVATVELWARRRSPATRNAFRGRTKTSASFGGIGGRNIRNSQDLLVSGLGARRRVGHPSCATALVEILNAARFFGVLTGSFPCSVA
jgi:hypothetical protein